MNNFNFDLDNSLDEDFFGNLKRKSSKLQQLFVDDELSSDDKQQSFKYQRPKDEAASSNVSTITLMAKVVRAFRQGELQGNVGLALIQNTDDTCNIIIYKTKSQILATLKLQPEKDLLYKQGEYWQFYDEVSTYWSLTFNTKADEEEFLDKLHMKSIKFKECREEPSVGKLVELPTLKEEKQSVNVVDIAGKIDESDKKEMKNYLIKRVAKMGKPLPTLPTSNPQVTTECSDSSDTEVIKTAYVSTQKPSIVSRSNKTTNCKGNQQLITSVVGLDSPTSAAVYSVNALQSQYMQMVITEQRTQGSELRMNMNKLENKIEKVLEKLDIYNKTDSNQKVDKEDQLLELEEQLLMLKKENRKLKQHLQDNNLKECEENKIKDILYEFKDDLNQFDIDYKQDLKHVLMQTNYKLKENYNKVKETEKNQDAQEVALKKVKAELDLITCKNIELENEIRLLKEQQDELHQQLSEKETFITKQNQKVLDMQKEINEKVQANPNIPLVKSIMNNLYVDIVEKFNKVNYPHSEEILSLIASSIKQQTLQLLQTNQ